MRTMNISEVFISWVLMLHFEADTCLLLNFISKPISLTFSVRQGDPFSMVLFILYIEPLLLRLQDVSSGLYLQARLSRSLTAPLEDIVKEDLEGYVDDSEVLCSCDIDFVNIDLCVERFERMSGAILNRSKKSVVLGLGLWSDRTVWPLSWLQTVTETKVFGFFLSNSYSNILERNWEFQFSKFTSTLKSWSSRAIDSLHQKAEILTTFALSKVWYRAQALPLPSKYVTKFNK